jgi:hypothetical protein
MTLQDLIAIANEAYPDDQIAQNFNPDTGRATKNSGDSLAYFIVQELIETFDDQTPTFIQLADAARAIHTAVQELASVEKRLKYAKSILNIPNDQVALHITSESEPIKKLLENRLSSSLLP